MIRKGLLLSLVPLGVIASAGVWGYTATEPGTQFPVHWGLDGRPDRFGNRFEAFFGLPLLALGLTVMFAVLPALDPRGDNLRRSGPAYLTSWLGALALLALVQLGMTLAALGLWGLDDDRAFPRIVVVGLALLLVAVGNVLGKARPNWFVGVRTPWTLTSDIAWDRTHRISGRLLVLVGFAGLAAAVAPSSGLALGVLTAGTGAVAVFSLVYSYLVWRGAPDKRTGPQAVDR